MQMLLTARGSHRGSEVIAVAGRWEDDSPISGVEQPRCNVPVLKGVTDERLTSAASTGEPHGGFSDVAM